MKLIKILGMGDEDEDQPESNLGGFQLLDLIITELESHMTCQKFKLSHWWKFYMSKKILNKICSPV